jgi:hypothetical protein
VKGAGFSPARNTPRAMKKRNAIARWDWRIEDRKTRILENRKGAAPENQYRSKAGPPGWSKQIQKFLYSHSSIADEGAKSAYG